jgi:CPA2 family monovalent cation:H+ antiporter-2
LAAGAVVGPFTPPFALVEDISRVQTLAQIGLVFLIFSIGLNLGLSRLKRLGISTAIATAITASLVLCGTRLFGWAIGWTATATLFLAGMLMVSSSAIISKVLDELNLVHERPGQLALAITIFEDVVAITVLTVLSSLARFGQTKPPPLGPTLAALGAFIVLLTVLSLLIMPRLLASLRREPDKEIRTLVVAGVLLALSWLAAYLGYSLALGAFVFGVIVGSTRYKSDIEEVFDGLRQLFGAVFFVAVGMLVDFRLLSTAWPLMLGVTVLALLLRPFAASLGFIAVGNSPREAINASLAVTPLGEFSFVIAQLGVDSGILPKSAYPVAAGASLLTALVAPILTKNAESLSLKAVQIQPEWITKGLTLYFSWLQRLRRRQTAGILWHLTQKRLIRIGLHMILVSALLLFIRPIYESARAQLGHDGALGQSLPFAFWSVFGLALLAPMIAIWRNISALTMILADAVTFGTQRQNVLRPIVERILNAIALLVLSGWLIAVLPSGWSLFGAAGGVLLLLVLVAAVFWRRFVKLQTRFEMRLIDRLHRASQVTSASAWSDTLPEQTADWDLEIEEVTLPIDSAHAGKSLHELALRTHYGCSVVGIDRQGYSIVNPRADTVLFPRDKILLLGRHAGLAYATRELLAFAPHGPAGDGFEDLTMATIHIPPGSGLAGKTLLELDLIHQFGVQVGGIRSNQRSIASPGGKERVEEGDELLLLGTPAQVAKFTERLIAPRTGK